MFLFLIICASIFGTIHMSVTCVEKSLKECSFCHEMPDKVFVCRQCHRAIYCGVPCQKGHWPEHKKVCRKGAEENIASAARKAGITPNQTAMQKMEEYLSTLHWQAPSEYWQREGWLSAAQKHTADPQFFDFPYAEPGAIAYDLGAGSGSQTGYLLNFGYRTVAIDSFEGFARHMRHLKEEDDLTVRETELSPEVLPRNGSVSMILAIDTLFYCSPKICMPLLSAAYQSLRPGGQFIVSFNDLSLANQIELALMKEMNVWCIPSTAGMKSALEEMGFIVRAKKNSEGPLVSFICTKRSSA